MPRVPTVKIRHSKNPKDIRIINADAKTKARYTAAGFVIVGDGPRTPSTEDTITMAPISDTEIKPVEESGGGEESESVEESGGSNEDEGGGEGTGGDE